MLNLSFPISCKRHTLGWKRVVWCINR